MPEKTAKAKEAPPPDPKPKKAVAPLGASYLAGFGKPMHLMTAYGPIEIRPAVVRLLPGKHTYSIPGRAGNFINSDGYEVIAAAVGARMIKPNAIYRQNPDTRQMEEVENPYVIEDAEGLIKSVWCRRVVAAFTPSGQLTFTERTLYFNVRSYVISSLLAKALKAEAAGEFMSQGEWDLIPNEKRRGLGFIVTEPGSSPWDTIGFKFKTTHPDVSAAFKEGHEIRRFAERRAQTICERAAYDHCPATTYRLPDRPGADGMFWLRMYAVSHQIPELERLFARLAVGDEPNVALDDIKVMRGTDVLAGGEHEALGAATTTPSAIEAKALPAATEEQMEEVMIAADAELDRVELMAKIGGAKAELHKETFKDICKMAGEAHGPQFKKLAEASDDAVRMMWTEMEKALAEASEAAPTVPASAGQLDLRPEDEDEAPPPGDESKDEEK